MSLRVAWRRPAPGLILLLTGLLLLGGCGPQQPPQTAAPPTVEKRPQALTTHGHTRIDNYYWLNQRENPEVIAYLEAENAYTQAMMQSTEKFQDKLYNEMVGRIKEDDSSLPYLSNGYWYQHRYAKGSEYPIYTRRKGKVDGPEETLLNVPALGQGHAYYQIGGLSVSPNNRFMAFGVDTVSRRKYTLYFKNLQTGELLADNIPNTTGGAVWAGDNQHVFYVTKDSTLRPHQVWRHKLGTHTAQDVLVHHEKDNTFSTGVRLSKSRAFIFITSTSPLSSETRFVRADLPTAPFRVIQKRAKDYEYRVDHRKDRFYILTNWKAPNFRLMTAPIKSPGRKNWKERIPHKADELLENVEVFKNYLAVQTKRGGLGHLKIYRLDKNESHEIAFDQDAYEIGIGVNAEMDSDVLRFNYTSMTTPSSIYDYNMKSHDRKLMKREEVLGGYKPDHYRTERLWATAGDGTPVPITLLYKKDTPRDGSAPLLLYAYGSYGISTDPDFRSYRLSLVNRGFVYAIAHVRGGQEMGRQWYEDGKLFKKRNTFTDFIDCGRYLVAEKWTSPDRLFAEGGSAGGLLIGAVINMAPNLFKGAIAAVPFVDVVTTMLDESIPLTTSEYDEWGNPNKKDYYEYMLSYSPYDNVEAKAYPALLVTTGLHDSQVQYWEPAKWVAKLRELKTDDNPLLLHTNMEFGHGGASGRFQRYRDRALEYAFFLNLAGIEE